MAARDALVLQRQLGLGIAPDRHRAIEHDVRADLRLGALQHHERRLLALRPRDRFAHLLDVELDGLGRERAPTTRGHAPDIISSLELFS